MNKLSPAKDAIIDKMICLAYPERVISEVAQVSRNAIQARRNPMVWNRGFWFVTCPCGKPVIDPNTDHFHDMERCSRRERRSRLLLRIVRNKRNPRRKRLIEMSRAYQTGCSTLTDENCS